jgi:hypothetical protein
MLTIRDLRTTLKFNPQEINSSIKHFAESVNIDFDVFLPSKNINLQREFVWEIEQKRELMWSVLMHRYIPRMAMIYTADGVYQVIDGKQRLSAMLDFYKGKYDLIIDEKSYFFNDLPDDYQRVISGFMFAYYVVHEDYSTKYTDEDKISWFRFINFAGTQQEANHLKKLS